MKGLITYPANKRYRSFLKSRIFVKKLKLPNRLSWISYVKGDLKNLPKLPNDIPKSAYSIYRDKAWISWRSFLGTGNPAPKTRVYIGFYEWVRKGA